MTNWIITPAEYAPGFAVGDEVRMGTAYPAVVVSPKEAEASTDWSAPSGFDHQGISIPIKLHQPWRGRRYYLSSKEQLSNLSR